MRTVPPAVLALLHVACVYRITDPGPPAPLPIAHGNTVLECGATAPGARVSPLQWIHSGDAFAYGMVTSVRPLRHPSRDVCATSDGHRTYGEGECPGREAGGLLVDLAAVVPLTGDAPEQLTVTLGAEVTDDWAPSPTVESYPDADVSLPLSWVPESDPGRVKPGQVLGGALWYDAAVDAWGVLDGPLFLVVEDRRVEPTVEIQQFGNPECDWYYPEGSSRTLPLWLVESLAAESPDEETATAIAEARARVAGLDREERLRRYWTSRCWRRCD